MCWGKCGQIPIPLRSPNLAYAVPFIVQHQGALNAEIAAVPFHGGDLVVCVGGEILAGLAKGAASIFDQAYVGRLCVQLKAPGGRDAREEGK